MLPLIIVRMFSSSAATGLALDIFCTMSVYFMTAKVTKTRYTLAGALVATLGGIAASILLAAGM